MSRERNEQMATPAPRPERAHVAEKQAVRLWQAVDLQRIDVDDPAITALLDAFRAVYVNGDALLVGLAWRDSPAFAGFVAGRPPGTTAFPDPLLTAPVVRSAVPELAIPERCLGHPSTRRRIPRRSARHSPTCCRRAVPTPDSQGHREKRKRSDNRFAPPSAIAPGMMFSSINPGNRGVLGSMMSPGIRAGQSLT